MNFFGTATARARECTPQELEIKRIENEVHSLEFVKARRLFDVQSLGRLIEVIEDRLRDRRLQLAKLKGTL